MVWYSYELTCSTMLSMNLLPSSLSEYIKVSNNKGASLSQHVPPRTNSNDDDSEGDDDDSSSLGDVIDLDVSQINEL